MNFDFVALDNLEADYLELKQKLDQMQSLAISLQVQLSSAQSELSDLRAENVERQALQDALDAAIIERAENDAKWQRDFEQLRTLNSGLCVCIWIFSNLFKLSCCVSAPPPRSIIPCW